MVREIDVYARTSEVILAGIEKGVRYRSNARRVDDANDLGVYIVSEEQCLGMS